MEDQLQIFDCQKNRFVKTYEDHPEYGSGLADLTHTYLFADNSTVQLTDLETGKPKAIPYEGKTEHTFELDCNTITTISIWIDGRRFGETSLPVERVS